MSKVDAFLIGDLNITDFLDAFFSEEELQDSVRNLIPPEAVNNRTHGLWRRLSYDALCKYNFDLFDLIRSCHKFDGSIADNLNIFGILEAVYSYLHPEISLTDKYSQAFAVYLDVVKDCYGGPEVDMLINNVVVSTLSLRTKKQRIQHAKDAISKLFLSESGKMPRWIQGAEWPMGERAPMVFVSQKKRGECIYYVFRDADTHQSRIIEQWY